ncbi:transposase [Micromonospora sp. NBC_01392]
MCLTARADGLFDRADAVLCADGPVRSLAELSLSGEHRRDHGALYHALACGRLDIDRLRTALAAVPLPRAADGRLVLAVDITCWLRPDAHTSPQRILCHTYGRGKDQTIMIPGLPYSMVMALESGRSSWTAPLDAVRLAPGDDAATVTAGQLRDIVGRLIAVGQWQAGTRRPWSWLTPATTRPDWRSSCVTCPCSPRADAIGSCAASGSAASATGKVGRPPRHGGEFVFGDPATWGEPDAAPLPTPVSSSLRRTVLHVVRQTLWPLARAVLADADARSATVGLMLLPIRSHGPVVKPTCSGMPRLISGRSVRQRQDPGRYGKIRP